MIWSPFEKVRFGVSSQLLMVFVPVVLLKFAPMYELVAPECDVKTVVFPWNQVVVPTGTLLFCAHQFGIGADPVPPVGATTVSNPSVKACAFAIAAPAPKIIAKANIDENVLKNDPVDLKSLIFCIIRMSLP